MSTEDYAKNIKWLIKKGVLKENATSCPTQKTHHQHNYFKTIISKSHSELKKNHGQKQRIFRTYGGETKNFDTAMASYLYLLSSSPLKFKEQFLLAVACIWKPFLHINNDERGSTFGPNRVNWLIRNPYKIFWSQQHALFRLARAELLFLEKNATLERPAPDGVTKDFQVTGYWIGSNRNQFEYDFVQKCGLDPDQKLIPPTIVRSQIGYADQSRKFTEKLNIYANKMVECIQKDKNPQKPMDHFNFVIDELLPENKLDGKPGRFTLTPELRRTLVERAVMTGIISSYKLDTSYFPRKKIKSAYVSPCIPK